MRFAGIKEDIIITAYGKPTAVLHHITEDDPGFKMKIEEAFAEYSKSG